MSSSSEKFSLNISLIIHICLHLCLYETPMARILDLTDRPWHFLIFSLSCTLPCFSFYTTREQYLQLFFPRHILIFHFCYWICSFLDLFVLNVPFFLIIPYFVPWLQYILTVLRTPSMVYRPEIFLLKQAFSSKVLVLVCLIFFPSFMIRSFLQMSGDSCLLRVKDGVPKGW